MKNKIILSLAVLFLGDLLAFTEDNASSKMVSTNPIAGVTKPVSNEYISQNEFENILKEAEDKLKMEKNKNKRLRDYVFELIDIKRKMYPHERVKAGLALEEMKEKYPDMAIKIFSKEIELNGGNKDAYFERGELYTRMCYRRNDKSICEKAVADLKEAIKHSKSDKDLNIWGIPFRMQVYDRLGYIYENTVIKDLRLALSYYTKSIESDPFQPSSQYFERARVYVMLKEYDKAIEDLKQYKKCTTNTNSDKEHKVYGLCYYLYQQSGREFINECPTKEEIEKKLNVKFKEEGK